MKISELNNKSFLGAPGAATNSYVLINYEDNTTNEPVTYKATLDELGKSIASHLELYKSNSNSSSAYLISANNGTYTETEAFPVLTDSEVSMIHAAQDAEAVEGKIRGILSDDSYIYLGSNQLKCNDEFVPYIVTLNPQTRKLRYYDPLSEEFIDFGASVVPSESAAPSESVTPSESEPLNE